MSFFKHEKHFLGKFGAFFSKLGEIKIFPSNLIPSIGNIYQPIINNSKEKQTVKWTIWQFHSTFIFLKDPKNLGLGKIQIIRRLRKYQLHFHVQFQFKNKLWLYDTWGIYLSTSSFVATKPLASGKLEYNGKSFRNNRIPNGRNWKKP